MSDQTRKLAAIVFTDIGEYVKAMEYYNQSFQMSEELGDKRGMANTLRNMGYVNIRIGDYNESLAQFSKSLSFSEVVKDTVAIARSYSSIADIEYLKGNYDKAEQFI